MRGRRCHAAGVFNKRAGAPGGPLSALSRAADPGDPFSALLLLSKLQSKAAPCQPKVLMLKGGAFRNFASHPPPSPKEKRKENQHETDERTRGREDDRKRTRAEWLPNSRMDAKWKPRGAKMEPKDTKMEPKGRKKELECKKI